MVFPQTSLSYTSTMQSFKYYLEVFQTAELRPLNSMFYVLELDSWPVMSQYNFISTRHQCFMESLFSCFLVIITLINWVSFLFTNRLNQHDNLVIFCNGNALHPQQCERGFGEWLDDIRAFSKILSSLEVDISTFACLSALVLVTGEFQCLFDWNSFANYPLC